MEDHHGVVFLTLRRGFQLDTVVKYLLHVPAVLGLGKVACIFGREFSVFVRRSLEELTAELDAVPAKIAAHPSVSNGVCKGWVSLRKETHCWLSTRRRVMSGARFRRRALSV